MDAVNNVACCEDPSSAYHAQRTGCLDNRGNNNAASDDALSNSSTNTTTCTLDGPSPSTVIHTLGTPGASTLQNAPVRQQQGGGDDDQVVVVRTHEDGTPITLPLTMEMRTTTSLDSAAAGTISADNADGGPVVVVNVKPEDVFFDDIGCLCVRVKKANLWNIGIIAGLVLSLLLVALSLVGGLVTVRANNKNKNNNGRISSQRGHNSESDDHKDDSPLDPALIQQRLGTYPLVLGTVSDASSFVHPETPQSMALAWLIYRDRVIQLGTSTSHYYQGDSSSNHHNLTMTEQEEQKLVQRYAVLVLYYSCGGENWRQFVAPLDEEVYKDECDFHGFGCDEDTLPGGTIDRVTLPSQQLAGQLPLELGLLTALTSLNLAYNLLEGPIPSALYHKLTGLEELSLESNGFSGTISEDIGFLTHLQILSVFTNNLQGTLPSSLTKLSRMKQFHIADNERIHGNNVFDLTLHMPLLESLVIGSTSLTGTIPTNIGTAWPNLRVFDLYFSEYSGDLPSEIVMLTNLKVLYLASANIGGRLPENIGVLTNLVELSFQGVSISGTIPASIGQCTNIQGLLLEECPELKGTLPTELGRLTNLESLFVEQTNLSGAIPSELGNIESLMYLYIRDNKFTGTIPDTLCKQGQELRYDCDLKCPCCRHTCRHVWKGGPPGEPTNNNNTITRRNL